MDTLTTKKFKELTPKIQDFNSGFIDADDELREIASYVKKTTTHNEFVEPDKVKFLYSSKPKKEGGRYVVSDLIKRSDMEKMIDDSFDFILTVFYDVWKDLGGEEKVILLDKALCGIDMASEKIGKKSPDSREYISNMMFYGADKVMRVSEVVDLTCQRVLEEKKEKAKNTSKKQVEHIDDVVKD